MGQSSRRRWAPGLLSKISMYICSGARSRTGRRPLFCMQPVFGGGRRLLLAGSTSAGKTTLALRLTQSGFEIEGDEHVLIDRAGVIARPRGCRVKTNALPLLPDMAKVTTAAPSYTDVFNGKIFNVDPWILARRGG